MFVYCKQKRETGSSRQAGKHELMLVPVGRNNS